MPALAALCVAPAHAAAFWPHVAPLIARAIRRGGLGRAADVARAVQAGAALLWLVTDGAAIHGAAVTELTLTDAGKVCTIVACGGAGLRRFLPLIADIERYARAEGCARLRVCGRRGWSRVLEDFHPRAVVLDRVL